MVLCVAAVQLWTLRVSQTALEQRIERNLDASLAVVKAYLSPLGTEWSREGGHLRLGTTVVDGLSDIVDRGAAASGGVATIFSDDMRVATNVLKPDGSRATGTKLTDAAVRATVLEQGQTYRGYTTLFNRGYLTIYEPIRDRSGHVVGILFAGIPSAELEQAKATVLTNAAVAGLVAVLLFAAVGAWLLKRTLHPLNQLATATQQIASGALDTEVPGIGRRDQVGAMASSLQAFRAAARERRAMAAETAAAHERAEDDRRQREARQEEASAAQASVVSALATGLEQLAAGNLTCKLEKAFSPEYEALRRNFNSAVTQLHELVGGIVANTADLKSGTGEITQAADDLSRRTEQNAASLEEAAAALDELTVKVTVTAAGAEEARNRVAQTRRDAQHSEDVLRQTVAAMSQIESSSLKVGEIIGVINEIAFQTNLLALNAGVEAARAGDAGRGFAVVASEVRSLAQRSGEAAKEINHLIATSAQQVKAGVALVGNTGEALSRIIAHVEKVSDLVGQIATSANEQATALAEVNTAVTEMDQTTQQNAAMVEQSTAASHALADKAGELAQLTERFQLGHADAGQITGRPALEAAAFRRAGSPRASRPAAANDTARRLRSPCAAAVSAPAQWEEF